MPQLHVTQGEQQIIASILRKELSVLNDTQTELRSWVKDIYDVRSVHGPLPPVVRRAAQRALHNQISRNNEKMKKRIELLKYVKNPVGRAY